MKLTLAFAFFVSLISIPALAEPPGNFNSAKKSATSLWWQIGPKSFYCSCSYRDATADEKRQRPGNLWVEADTCGYRPKLPVTSSGKPNARATRIEWEHIVPADWIATGFGCREMTRAQCREIPGYDQAEGDLFNLYPAVGELNGDRSNLLYGEIPGEPREYGACDFEVKGNIAEPMDQIRGDVARVWFYMADKYGVVLTTAYKTMLEAWSAADPVDDVERARHAVIAKEMGWNNPYVAGQ